MKKLLTKLLLVYLLITPTLQSFSRQSTIWPAENFNFSSIQLEAESETGDILFTEDFSGTFPPEEWSLSGVEDGTNWILRDGTVAGGTSPEASFYSYNYNAGSYINGTSRMVSPKISTDGNSALSLEFKQGCSPYKGTCEIRVETSSDGGTTWNEVWSDIPQESSSGETKVIVLENTDVEADSIQFAFVFEGNSSQFNKWRIDDVVLSSGQTEFYDAAFVVKENGSDVPIEGAKVSLEGATSTYTDALGEVQFEDLLGGVYTWEVNAYGFTPVSGTVNLEDEDEDEAIEVFMEELHYLFYEDFDDAEPSGWIKQCPEAADIRWFNDEMIIAQSSLGDVIYITPEINLACAASVTVEVGGKLNYEGAIGIGIYSDPTDAATYFELGSFEVNVAYEYHTIELPDNLTSFYIGLKHTGSNSNFFNLNTVYVTPKTECSPQNVSFTVRDDNNNLKPNAEVYIEGQGALTTDANGQIVFNDIYTGDYAYCVYTDKNDALERGVVSVGQEDISVDVTMKAPEYFYYCDFEDDTPEDYTYISSGSDRLFWNEGTVLFYNRDENEDFMTLVTPEIDLSSVSTVTIRAGGNVSDDGFIIFGTLSNPNSSNTFTSLDTFSVDYETRFITLDVSEYDISDTYFGFKHEGSQYDYYYAYKVFMEGNASVDKQAVTFTAKNESQEVIKDATIEVPGYRSIVTDDQGQAIFNLYPSFFRWEATADNYFEKSRIVTVDNADMDVDVELRGIGDYFFLEDFDLGIQFNWTQVVSSGDYISCWLGQVGLSNYADTDDPLMLVSPEINLSKVDSITVEIGREQNAAGEMTIVALTDPSDLNSMVELGSVEPNYEYDFYTIDVSDIDINASYLGFKHTGEYACRFYLKNIYVEGSGTKEYCEPSVTSEAGYIACVKFDDIDNSSNWQSELADYTELSTRIQQGTSTAITVTNGSPSANDNVTVWVDWNSDLEFEASAGEEFVLVNDGTGTTFTGDITVPEGVDFGKFRMRVRIANNAAPEPCGDTENGEIEDYSIIVDEELDPDPGVIFAEDFESYTSDQLVACQNPDLWTTSDDNPCGANDALVSTDVANSGVNSANIMYGDDLIMPLDNGFTQGVHTVTSMLYIPTGGVAQVNILSKFLESIEYGFEASFDLNGNGSVNAGGADAATFTFDNDTWIESKIEIDLYKDSAEFFIDENSVIKWQWTAGSTGNGSALKLAALNLSGVQTGTSYYVDDVSIETLPIYPPLGFTAEVFGGANVELNWVAPRGEGYLQHDNGTNYTTIRYGDVFFIASRWSAEDLATYDENYITSIIFYAGSGTDATFTLKAWTGEMAETEILSQEVTSYNEGAFNEIELETPIKIDAFKDLWFGVKVMSTVGYVLGVDSGPSVEGYGDLYSYDGVNWSLMSANYDFNFNLSAKVSADANGLELAEAIEKEVITSSVKSNLTQNSETLDLVLDNEAVVNLETTSTAASIQQSSRANSVYNVYRNDALIAEGISEVTYSDMGLDQGQYTFDVRAVYDETISSSAKQGPIDVVIGTFVERDFVILEIETGTWCPFCPGAAMGADELVHNGHNVAVIEYHRGDDFETVESGSRADFYEAPGLPHSEFDGVIEGGGGSNTVSAYSIFLPKYETRNAIQTPFALESAYYNITGNSYFVDIDVELVGIYSEMDNLRVFAVLTESNIECEWQSMDELNFVCRDMIPDQYGTKADFTEGTTQSFELDFTIQDEWEMDNLELVVFIQDINTEEILQGTIAQLETLEHVLATPENLTVTVEGDTDIILSWDAVNAGENVLTGYNIYRQMGDAESILLTTVSGTSYTDNVSETGTCKYYVTAVYDEGESYPSNTVTVEMMTSIFESILSNTKVYPNPATGVVNINSSYVLESVKIYNYAGQIVLSETVNSTTCQVNTSDLDSGIYLFLIETNEGSIEERIIIQ